MWLSSEIPATAPVDMVMPVAAHWIFGGICVVLTIVTAVVLGRASLRQGSFIPLAFMFGGSLVVFCEPMFDVLGNVWFPAHGHPILFAAFEHYIPWWVLLMYAFYMGGQAYYFYTRMERGISGRSILNLFLLFAAADVVMEVVAINLGAYSYYGDQPFNILKFPAWWGICNGGSPVAAAALIYLLRNRLHGAAQLMAIPMVTMAVVAAESALGWPVFFALHSGVGLVGTNIAAIISLLLAGVLLYVVSAAVSAEARGTLDKVRVGFSTP